MRGGVSRNRDRSAPAEQEPEEFTSDPLDFLTDKPVWQQEGFASRQEYNDYYWRLSTKCLEDSERKFRPIKQRQFKTYRRIELDDLLAQTYNQDVIRTDVPFLPQTIEDIQAALTESVPIPSVSPRQSAEDDLASGLNYQMAEVLDANDYETRIYEIAYDMAACNLGILKTVPVTDGTAGPFKQPTRISIDKVDPRYCWPDPMAKRLSSKVADWEFLMFVEPKSLSEIRQLFGEAGRAVAPESVDSEGREMDQDGSVFSTPFNDDLPYAQGTRHMAMLRELWVRDKRVVMKPLLNGETLEPLRNSDGELIGKHYYKYPHGRAIWLSNGIVLRDIPNPFNHGHVPYTFFKLRLSPDILSFGIAEVLMHLEDKMNTLAKDMFHNARFNMNSPFLADITAFESREDAENLVIEPGLIIFKVPGTTIDRMMPADFPSFVFPLTDYFRNIFDDVSGMQSINRGMMQKGAQLSADAIVQLQGGASGRPRMRARILEMSVAELGYQTQGLIRQIHPGTMSATIMDSSRNESVNLTWNNDDWDDDLYAVGVEAGSALPGAKQSFQQLALTLYREGAADRQFLFESLQIPGYMAHLKRIEDRETMLAYLGHLADRRHGAKAGRKPQTARM